MPKRVPSRLLQFVACAVLLAGCDSPKPEHPQPQQSRLEVVSARELISAYASNGLAANRRFQGRRVRVTGETAAVESTLGIPTILIDARWTGDAYLSNPRLLTIGVQCALGVGDANNAAQLSVGSQVVAEGLVVGLEQNVQLLPCRIVTPQELRAAAEADRAAAESQRAAEEARRAAAAAAAEKQQREVKEAAEQARAAEAAERERLRADASPKTVFGRIVCEAGTSRCAVGTSGAWFSRDSDTGREILRQCADGQGCRLEAWVSPQQKIVSVERVEKIG